MHKFPIFEYSRFDDLPFKLMHDQRFSIYILDLNWNYQFINSYACQSLDLDAKDLIGENMWKLFQQYIDDPEFIKLKESGENNMVSNITTLSPVTGEMMSVTCYPLTDCYYLASTVLASRLAVSGNRQIEVLS